MSFKDQQYGRWKSGKTMCLIQFLPGRSNERLMTPATELLSMICMVDFFLKLLGILPELPDNRSRTRVIKVKNRMFC